MGVIDSLSAGYRIVGRRLYLLVIPIALDLLLWWVPRLSVAPLLDRLAAFYEEAMLTDALSGELAQMAEQAAVLLREMGRSSNLLNMLVSNSLLHVPSILVVTEPVREAAALPIENLLVACGLTLILSLLGILIGVIYLGLLAYHVPIGEGEKTADPARFLQISGRRWLSVILFVFLTIFILFALYIPVTIAIALAALVIPVLSSLLILLLGGMTFLLFFYLYFVVVAIIVDDLSIFDALMCSVRLVRANFWSTLGFVVLVNLISLGFALLLSPFVRQPPLGTTAAILSSAYIGTGLSMALLVFYRSQLLKMQGDSAASSFVK